MAITTTEMLGTDSISASRIVINDNFSILRDEINAIEAYIDPEAGTVDGLTSLSTLELRVGTSGNYDLEITGSGFNINSALTITDSLEVNGLISHNSFGLLDEASFTGTAEIDPLEGFGNYSVVHSSTSNFVIELGEGNPGQEISFYLEQKGGGSVIVQSNGDSPFVLDPSVSTIEFLDIGSSVTLKYVLDSTSNGAWYIVSSHNIVLI